LEKSKNRVAEKLNSFQLVPAAEERSSDKVVERIMAYFEEKTGGNRLPRRSDISPLDLKDILPEVVFIVPVFNDEGACYDATVKLEGTEVSAYYGEFTGKSIFDHSSSVVSKRIFEAVQKVLSGNCAIVAKTGTMKNQELRLRVKTLYAPMAEDGMNIDQIFVHARVYGRIDDLL